MILKNFYTDTFDSDDTYEVVTERQSGGRPANRYSYLEHVWTFDITGWDLELHAEAFHSANDEGDDFILSGSFDGANYTDLITVTKTADDDIAQSQSIDGEASGTYYVKLTDTDQTRGNRNLDSFSLDMMSITYMSGQAPDLNDAPEWTNYPTDVTVNYDDTVEFTVTGTDADGDPLTITFDIDPVPAGFNPADHFSDNTDGTADFSWATVEADINDYTATFTIEDNSAATDVAVVNIHVVDPNDLNMHVESIDLSPVVKRNKTKAVGTITILDGNRGAVSGASVSVTWSDLHSGNDQATTDAQGEVVFESGQIRRANGEFTLTVTAVSKNGWTYNSGANVVSSATLGVGDFASGDNDGIIHSEYEAAPEELILEPAFPNPFNSYTYIKFGLPEASMVRLNIYDLTGRRVKTLIEGYQGAGWHSAIWIPEAMSTGMYILTLEADNALKLKRAVYIK